MNVTKLKTTLEKTTAEALQQLNLLQDKIRKINDEIYWLDSAPMPLEDAIINIDGFIKKNSQAKEVGEFFHAIERGETARLFESHSSPDGYGINVAPILCVLFPELIRNKLIELATEAAAGIESGPPLAEREQLKVALLKTRQTLEIEEEAVISSAEEMGFTGFYRRADCDPEIVLMM